MKRSEIRGLLVDVAIPNCAALQPGYRTESSYGGLAERNPPFLDETAQYASLLPLAQPSSAVEYGWVASYPLCIALRSCGLPAPVFESRHDGNYKDIAHTDRLVRAARFGQERAG